MRHLAAILLAASCAFAQDMRLVPKACGPETVNFDVRMDRALSLPKPEPGKALVYVIQDGFDFGGCLKCPSTARVGLDGTWMGANNKLTWISFTVPPGDHHLCADLQASKLYRLVAPQRISLAGFTAQAGVSYYFRVLLLYGAGGAPLIDLEPINADEGKLLIASYYPSASTPKK